jgi:hypothetical protein
LVIKALNSLKENEPSLKNKKKAVEIIKSQVVALPPKPLLFRILNLLRNSKYNIFFLMLGLYLRKLKK